MLSFLKGHMASIEGIEIYPLISLIIFFVFFVGLGFYLMRFDKDRLKELKNLPLEEDNENVQS